MSSENIISKKRTLVKSRTTLPTVEAFDAFFDSPAEEITSASVCDAVKKVYGIDIDLAMVQHAEYEHLNQPRMAISNYLQQHSTIRSGVEIRSMIKLLFGINLVGIAEIYKDRISLYSKDQWIVKNDQALFLVHTGKKDVDVKILPTPYFKEHTGLDELPQVLQQELALLGYSYNAQEQAVYYTDPESRPVSGEFKVLTMKTIAKIVHREYADL